MRWLVLVLLSSGACESAGGRVPTDGGGSNDRGPSLADGDLTGADLSGGVDLGPTWGSMCGAMTAKVSGQVFAPNGIDPVPMAAAYLVREVVPIAAGVSCDVCGIPSGADSTWVEVQTGVDG